MLERLVTPNSKSWIVARTAHAEYVKVPEFWVHEPARVDEVLRAHTVTPSEPKEQVVPYSHLLESVASAR
jgi:hypothetical protein